MIIKRANIRTKIDLASRRAPVLHTIRCISNEVAAAPVTRYYGSKRRLLSWLFEVLRPLKFNTAIDAFGGTASVSHLLRAMRKDVSFNDAFLFNSDVAHTVLRDHVAVDRESVLEYINAITPVQGVVSSNFKGIFYTTEENAWIDGFIVKLLPSSVPKPTQSLLRYLLYQACLKKRPFNLFHRANLRLRTNNSVKRSFGNATTWNRSFTDHILMAYDELASRPPLRTRAATILPPTDATKLPQGYDLVYLDPPYLSNDNKSKYDNYWRKYHFLEGLARYEDWSAIIDPLSPIGLPPAPSSFELWANPKLFKQTLFTLIKKNKNSIVVLSYVRGTRPSEEEIKDFFEANFLKVTVHSMDHSHALSKQQKRELVFVGQPK